MHQVGGVRIPGPPLPPQLLGAPPGLPCEGLDRGLQATSQRLGSWPAVIAFGGPQIQASQVHLEGPERERVAGGRARSRVPTGLSVSWEASPILAAAQRP